MIDLFTAGVKHFYDTEEEVIYYYTDSMRDKGITITVETTYMEDHANDIQDLITVHVLLEGNAYHFIVHWDTPLPPLVTRRMIKDIVVFQKYKTKAVFIEFCKEMSVQYMSAAQQSKDEHNRSIVQEVRGHLSKVEAYEKTNS